VEAVVERNGVSRPIGRRVLARAIDEHIGVIVLGEPDRNDPGLVALLGAAGVDRNNDAAKLRRGIAPQFIELVALPESTRRIVEQLSLQFLSAKSGTFVFSDDLVKKRWGEVRAVVVAAPSGFWSALASWRSRISACPPAASQTSAGPTPRAFGTRTIHRQLPRRIAAL